MLEPMEVRDRSTQYPANFRYRKALTSFSFSRATSHSRTHLSPPMLNTDVFTLKYLPFPQPETRRDYQHSTISLVALMASRWCLILSVKLTQSADTTFCVLLHDCQQVLKGNNNNKNESLNYNGYFDISNSKFAKMGTGYCQLMKHLTLTDEDHEYRKCADEHETSLHIL